MEQNLAEFVKKFVQDKGLQGFPHLYIVDKTTGPYYKIQDALNDAQPNSLIKVSQGFYEENLIITKPVKIEPKSYNHQGHNQKIGVILLVESGIAIHVKLPQNDSECCIRGVKVSHSGNSDNTLKQQFLEHQHILQIFGGKNTQIQQPDHQYVNRAILNKIQSMILYVQRGVVNIQNSLLSLSYLVKSCSTAIPAVCIEKQGTANISHSEIKGHEKKKTIGIINKLGVLSLEDSIVTYHNQGGILIWGVCDNPSKIFRNLFENNSVAIHAVGQSFKMKIYANNINNNIVGIKVGLACEVEISRNNIANNIDGIQICSGFPTVYLNRIQNQQNCGIICKTFKRFICKARIRKNIAITGNKLHGIFIEGQNNRSNILQNYLIGFNKECGIKVTKDANPLILQNKIYKNFKEGILITENSSAVIQANIVSHNIECNIALGGNLSHHNLIVENILSNSSGPGILLLQAGKCHISRNDIIENLDGIVLRNSRGNIRRNYIANNKNDGLKCQDSSTPNIIQNLITMNKSIGLFLRDLSYGKIHSNIIANNEVEVGLQQYDKQRIKQLSHSNTIEGQIHHPPQLSCQLI